MPIVCIIIDNSNSFRVIIVQFSIQPTQYNRQHQAGSRVDTDFHDVERLLIQFFYA